MNRLVIGFLTGVLLFGVALAQDSVLPEIHIAALTQQERPAATQSVPANSGQSNDVPRLAPGTVIPVELAKAIDAKKVKAGDAVEAKVTEDLRAANGQVVIPKDTKFVGHVTAAQARDKEQKESQVGIAFDREVTKNGSEVPLPMSIQAIIAPSALGAGTNSNSGSDRGGPGQTPGAGETSPAPNGGRSTGMGTGAPSAAPAPSSGGQSSPSEQTGTAPHQPITAKTQGVVGISNLKLSTTADTTLGSVVSSEKSNVKLDTGTLMLLRVNP